MQEAAEAMDSKQKERKPTNANPQAERLEKKRKVKESAARAESEEKVFNKI